jgi:hypothetical protein
MGWPPSAIARFRARRVRRIWDEAFSYNVHAPGARHGILSPLRGEGHENTFHVPDREVRLRVIRVRHGKEPVCPTHRVAHHARESRVLAVP